MFLHVQKQGNSVQATCACCAAAWCGREHAACGCYTKPQACTTVPAIDTCTSPWRPKETMTGMTSESPPLPKRQGKGVMTVCLLATVTTFFAIAKALVSDCPKKSGRVPVNMLPHNTAHQRYSVAASFPTFYT